MQLENDAAGARLKDDIETIGDTSHPDISRYAWNWRPEAEKSGPDSGFIAQEIESVWPELVVVGDDGYKRIMKPEVEKRLEKLDGR